MNLNPTIRQDSIAAFSTPIPRAGKNSGWLAAAHTHTCKRIRVGNVDNGWFELLNCSFRIIAEA